MRATADLPVYVFSNFRLDPVRRRLTRGDETVPLHSKAFELLTLLVENNDRVLTKNELLNTIWESQFVEENNLAVQIAALRKTFGERSGENRFIATVPGRGYQFVAEVKISNEKVLERPHENGREITTLTPPIAHDLKTGNAHRVRCRLAPIRLSGSGL